MRPSILRRVAWLALVSFSAATLTPPAALAAAGGAAAPREQLTAKVASKIYTGLRTALVKTLERASRSERINLKLNFSFLDDSERMLFDISGIVKVKVPSERVRERFAKQMEDEETKVMSTNGPLSIDAAVTPVAIEGEDAVFAVQVDLTILTHAVFQLLIRSALQVGSVIALNTIAGKAIEALAGFSHETAGKAVELGVENLSAVVSGEAGAIAYATFQDQHHKTWKEKAKATLTPAGLFKHFALAAIFAATTSGMQVAGASLGAAVGAALIPGGSTILGTIAATSALVWVGNFVVSTVGVKWPVLWKLAKIGRLYRKAIDSDGARQRRLSEKYGEYIAKVQEKVLREMDSGYKRWVFLELAIKYFRKRVRDAGPLRNALVDFDVVPYQQLIDGICAALQFRMKEHNDWYAARMYFQLKDAVNQLPEGYDHRPTPGELIQDVTENGIELDDSAIAARAAAGYGDE